MLKIALCDDERHIHDIIGELLQDYSKDNNIDVQMLHYYSADMVLKVGETYDFLLLDIDMPDMDGIELAARLRDNGNTCKIIMLTGRIDRFKEAFEINAFRFVSKPVDKKELYRAIDDVRKQIVGCDNIIGYRDGIRHDIVEKEVLFFEADGSSSLIYTENADYRSEKSLSEWLTVLDMRIFFQCHKSYIINLAEIETIDKTFAIMRNGDKVSVSRRLHKPLLYAYMDYDTNRR